MKRELSRLADCPGENQKRDRSCTRAEREERRVFERAAAVIVKEQRAAAVIKPEKPKKESHVTDARGDECFLRRGRGARPVDPKSDEQIRGEPDQFPKNE